MSSLQFLKLILVVLVISVFYSTTTHPDGSSLSTASTLLTPAEEDRPTTTKKDDDDIVIEELAVMPKCDLFSGKWVYHDESYPLYKEKECSFMSDQFACEKFGRRDLTYQHWRWQPHHCDLPRFNSTALLERLRNKRLMFVGDSINRGQWISMVCLVETNIPPSLKSIHYNGSLITFKALDYNASIEFYWAPLLVESNSDDPLLHRLPERVVRTQAIEKHARHWTDANILVFDTYLWWRARPTMKILWGEFESQGGIYKEVDAKEGYEMALRTWSDWLEIHVNHSKTQVFWMSLSPTHQRSEDWGGEIGSNCYNETQPIFKQDYWGSGSDPTMIKQVEFEIEKLSKKGVNILLLNITQLSEYRKEAHLSIYKIQRELITDQLANPSKNADCFHWCLPGVPDIWNELLYAYIFNYA